MALKRTPLKKVGKRTQLRRLMDKADRALQDWYRFTYKNKCCEVCLNQFNIMHHFVEKSQSARLRYEPLNLVFLCNSCHAKHHLAGDPSVVSTVLLKRKKKWYDKLMSLRKERLDLTMEYLNNIIKKYEL